MKVPGDDAQPPVAPDAFTYSVFSPCYGGDLGSARQVDARALNSQGRGVRGCLRCVCTGFVRLRRCGFASWRKRERSSIVRTGKSDAVELPWTATFTVTSSTVADPLLLSIYFFGYLIIIMCGE